MFGEARKCRASAQKDGWAGSSLVGLNRAWQRSTFGEADGPGAQGNSWGVEVEVEGEVVGRSDGWRVGACGGVVGWCARSCWISS